MSSSGILMIQDMTSGYLREGVEFFRFLRAIEA